VKSAVSYVISELSDNFRTRILETLELTPDAGVQRQYQGLPHVDVPAELFNQWDDFYSRRTTSSGVFNDAELDALRRLISW
jgi:hypothetical protein